MNATAESESSKPPSITVDFVLLPHFSLLTFTAAADALTTANLVTGKQRFGFRTIALQEHTAISDLGIQLPADYILDQAESAALANGSKVSFVLVCGGYRCDLQEYPPLSAWLRLREQHGCQLGGLWNGSLAVAQAGLMSDHACALHPDNHALAVSQHPDMQIRPDTLVLDRNRLSAAGPSSAFELMLMLIGRHDSAETVQAIRQILKADTAGTPGKRQRSGQQGQEALPAALQTALRLMNNHLDEPISKRALAQHISLSTRAMERLFQQHLDTSPARYYRQLRLQRAHELLTQGKSSIGEISDVCGFVSQAHFSRSFQQRYGQAPSAVRRSVKALLEL